MQVLSAHHVHSDEDFFSSTKRSFECTFEVFGELTRLIGDVVESSGSDSGEVKFFSNETKFFFSSSISALEAMFDSMPPVVLKFRPLEDNPDGDLPQFARTLTVTNERRKSFARSRNKPPVVSSADFLANRKSSGKISFQNLHKDRCVQEASCICSRQH